ncbi:MAG: RNA pseudouridine synthase [Deltaproteobacteria bacterium HGW-Deltaproteobacteria-15]|jgi:23S rRNA pseudouridine1911/1915/1917 synthase|nr:MAG: RNA pseudouridine synthase [Deltaproteobacteria bacterium HGW-Deltaproteobacteria-15]
MVENPPGELTPENLLVLYEDNHIIGVHKPAGVLVQGDKSGAIHLMELVKQYIKRRYQKPGDVFLGLVHRIDRPVSGVVVFARTSKAASRLCTQWRSREVEKIYWALVHGRLQPANGTLRSYLRKGSRKVFVGSEGEQTSREAILSYRTISGKRGLSLIEIHLHTGRKHQIRVQLAEAGCPISGDWKYGSAAFDRKEIRLTAHSLTFVHPTRAEKITIESPAPEWALEFLNSTSPHPD